MVANLISASLLVCGTVLWEKNDVPSAIRVMSAILLGPGVSAVQFATLVQLSANLDFSPHTLLVQILGPTHAPLAQSAAQRFVFGSRIDPTEPGGFTMSTDFNFHIAGLGTHWVQAVVDGEVVIQIPILIQRKQTGSLQR
jgi:hypothetical protein